MKYLSPKWLCLIFRPFNIELWNLSVGIIVFRENPKMSKSLLSKDLLYGFPVRGLFSLFKNINIYDNVEHSTTLDNHFMAGQLW